jgi:hypothetical protein
LSGGSPAPDASGSGLVLVLTLLRWGLAAALSGRAIVVAVRALRMPGMPPRQRALYVVVALATIAAAIGLAASHLGRPSDDPPR